MSIFKKNEKKIPDGKFRIIKIGKEALIEFIYESMLDNQEAFFNVTDVTSIATHFDIDLEKGELTCVVRNQDERSELSEADIDALYSKLESKLESTTNTLFCDDRYIELSKEEIEKL